MADKKDTTEIASDILVAWLTSGKGPTWPATAPGTKAGQWLGEAYAELLAKVRAASKL